MRGGVPSRRVGLSGHPGSHRLDPALLLTSSEPIWAAKTRPGLTFPVGLAAAVRKIFFHFCRPVSSGLSGQSGHDGVVVVIRLEGFERLSGGGKSAFFSSVATTEAPPV